MLFVSMCNDVTSGLFERNKGRSMGLMLTSDMASGDAVVGGLFEDEGFLKWGSGAPNRAETGLTPEEGKSEYEKGISYEAVKDTEENPILFVLCNEIQLYQGIEAEMKLLRLDDEHILAALITGACVFNGVPLQRCNNSNLDVAKVVKTIDIKNLFGDTTPFGKSLVEGTKETVEYSFDVLCHAKFIVRVDGSYSQRSISSKEYIFDETHKIEAEERVKRIQEEAKRKAEELKARREAEKQAMEEAKAEKARKEREKREAEADLKLSGVKVSKDTKVVNVGASEFLRAVAMANN